MEHDERFEAVAICFTRDESPKLFSPLANKKRPFNEFSCPLLMYVMLKSLFHKVVF